MSKIAEVQKKLTAERRSNREMRSYHNPSMRSGWIGIAHDAGEIIGGGIAGMTGSTGINLGVGLVAMIGDKFLKRGFFAFFSRTAFGLLPGQAALTSARMKGGGPTPGG